MKIDVLTLFPEMFGSLNHSILATAMKKKLLTVNVINIRDFSADKHKKCDDTPFGGGAGMVMTCQPLYDAIKSVRGENTTVCYLSPKGETLTQNSAKEMANIEHLVLICGHYEGIDQRILDIFNAKEISIGDYVLTGGELPAMVLIDVISRYIPGVLSEESVIEESFSDGMLEYPHYTKPQVFMGMGVPEVLLSGNHQEIKKWREKESERLTLLRRPDLLKNKPSNKNKEK